MRNAAAGLALNGGGLPERSQSAGQGRRDRGGDRGSCAAAVRAAAHVGKDRPRRSAKRASRVRRQPAVAATASATSAAEATAKAQGEGRRVGAQEHRE